MSVRYEWMSAGWCSIEAHAKGTELGEATVDADYALTISGDEVTVIEGSLDDLRVLLTSGLLRLEALDRQRALNNQKKESK